MANKEDICKGYFELKPQEASYFDFVRIFYSNELEKRNFFDVSAAGVEKIRGFRRRWLIFISVVTQRLLFLFKIPMANFGSFIELLLNYPSFNGGFLQLFFNILQGKAVRPEKSSEKFRSMIGNLDMREELDKTIKIGDRKEDLKEILGKNEKAKFIVTGHSLGGALAILFAAVLILHEEEWLLDKLEGVYTFGQPRVGDEQFGKFMMEKLKKFDVKYFRYVYCNDMVPRLPYDDKTLFFKHFGSCLFYNSLYNGQVLEEEPNKNYFSLLWVLPKVLNAGFELIRSLILPWIKGSDYKQSWSQIILRMVGLVIPGLSAHGPVDYVNLTRLGSILRLPQSQQGLKRD
ncbi:hypothetical protein HAX54_031237 [Datura stramonium]|uniref:Fungal lipase-type domain-containing protein n=1 Tax=Datura stramonium TaxID=4076 RepID=A0ABS8V9M8_DATST|nr:hypothetical protein [Datura stramonium]